MVELCIAGHSQIREDVDCGTKIKTCTLRCVVEYMILHQSRTNTSPAFRPWQSLKLQNMSKLNKDPSIIACLIEHVVISNAETS